MTTPAVVLTIAGSDSGGGAGIQADLRTFAALGVHGACAITAVTAQNTAEVRAVHPLPPEVVDAQIAAVLADLSVAAVKTGMLATTEIARVVAARARAGALPHLVVDPVLVASSGGRLFDASFESAYLDLLFPVAEVVTPNLAEAEVLLGRQLSTLDDMAAAAEELAKTGATTVVVKGGHLPGVRGVPRGGRRDAIDVVWHAGDVTELRRPWVATTNNHGTGCSFASATAAGLARGRPVLRALEEAKDFVTAALAGGAAWRLGAGHGPLDHMGWTSLKETP
ncbi:MAG TPA: bifunctional hydroxymethylpyrimidine kinase/phosphomethylpyrimidine kinase [Acidimicrobiia bacterium]|jgi:hydroxymethylpyrimidine/phosphomethylpyrimidine kinase